MSYLEHFNDQARTDVRMILHTQLGCKCDGDGVHAAPSNDDHEKPAAASARSSKRQKTSKAAVAVNSRKGDKTEGNASMQAPSLCKTFYLSELFLVSTSKYFRTCLETAVGGLETEMSTVGKLKTITILHEYIEEGEMEAVELVLKSFYAMGEPPLDTLPSAIDAKVPLLLKALMVAERYQAERCKEKIAEALSSIPASDLTLELAKSIFDLPPPLLDLQHMSGVKTNIKLAFYKEMDFIALVSETIKDHDMLKVFLALPLALVLEWIKRDDLKVHSENDVVYLLNKWITKNNPSSDQRDALVKVIRVIHLGPAYLHSILPNLQWFKDSPLSKSLWIALTIRDSKSDFDEVEIQCPDFPPSWLSAPRKAPGYAPLATTAFTWVLKEDQLKQLYDGFTTVYSEPVYHNGHWIRGLVELGCGNDMDENEVCSLFVGLHIHQPLPGLKYLVHHNCTVTIENVGNAPEMRLSANLICKSDRERGWHDFLKRQCPTLQEVVAPYLVDGKLTIKYEIRKVDEALVID